VIALFLNFDVERNFTKLHEIESFSYLSCISDAKKLPVRLFPSGSRRTGRRAYLFKVLVPGEYFMRINDGSPADNPGKVIDRVSTSKE